MNIDYTIDTFMEYLWRTAKEVLSEANPEFASQVEAHERLKNSGRLIIARPFLQPSVALPGKWHDILETTVEVQEDIGRLEVLTSLVTPQSTKREVHVLADQWYQVAYNLTAKVQMLITQCCRVSSLGQTVERKHCDRLSSTDVVGAIPELRHPLVHGAGGKGSVVKRAITEDLQAWEHAVAAGPHTLEEMVRYDESTEDNLSSADWSRMLAEIAALLTAGIAGVLRDFEKEMSASSGKGLMPPKSESALP